MNILSYLQRIGRALMVPVATLPAAAILVGIGYWIDPTGWGANNALAALLLTSGNAILENMGMLFAVGIAYGMSKDKDGAAALAGLIGFIVVIKLCSPSAVAMITGTSLEGVPTAFSKINNPFIGILVGVFSAELYNRYSNVELPLALSFFSGRRLVPILNSFLMIIVSLILMFVWTIVYDWLVAFGESITNLGSAGAGLYAFFNRLLIPIGLHHALNSVFWFDVAGINDIPNFLAGQKSIEAGTAIPGITGRYQAGFFPIMMFGLPGAALAIYHCARPENKVMVGGIMMAGAFAAFFTGITEPLEFSFMFVAPVLYVLHAIMTGISVYIAAAMHWIAGFGFSAGFVDLLLSSRNPLAVHWYMLILQGLVFFCLYYVVFRFTIKKFNLMTLGREMPAADQVNAHNADRAKNDSQSTNNIQEEAYQYIASVGGSDNLTAIDACISRLRLSVKDSGLVSSHLVKRLGASGIVRLNKQSVQIIVGMRAELIANAMHEVLARGPVPASTETVQSETQSPETTAEKQKKKTILTLMAPMSGEVVNLEDVPDEAFSSKLVGEGIAIRPISDIVFSPVDGTVVKIFDTNHALCITTDNGVEVIVHIGIDTVSLDGKGFERLVEEGMQVKAGSPILKLDLNYLNLHAKSLISPVIISNIDDYEGVNIICKGSVTANKSVLFQVI
ncbi:PTS family enzyme IIC (N-terminal); enzyme IIB (center); enzyme IIA (C-terminal), N-acetylglucosamine-specific [Xenorhabdus nematophila ATCC 19061]|uniref:PTS family enzyme IIC (N-terminal) enzyme IIB (Center) enzyme IIA (C-terminal), N-acetylglucosamine-specific n=1 Tax=Xenorhabdus nematophila (strain ATCC 19061 / DSM 3370 / CCUG 14189 / LMG 1036 / NCIMB 9965 / AN6) TaxID=406817 RepID=D3VAI4_XENNA|nr:N-acetylglucosamine-specific PTS transporter subunit IIBC [Xenorhabdus nematophila]CBJ89420.1 PTS family enzyme IIC (N-terminal); enzyme IIB (center); enzyme IIA (C-terminal), N-acetylglucosamine-specific [Xenorhabdus nematophila ATCC 19061]CEK22315.1 PTS family enzyme IIC (N-terminal); enzyme IIB (center); enzyme IIA (C-terminal), N-acetylglucosamine-specific [Xenorhabdus nematophila AN6/1]